MSDGRDQRQVALAAVIAADAHRDQLDKLGAAYIAHPARVATSITDDPVASAAAWLHDVLEDTPLTADDLAVRGVTPEVLEIVELMTRHDDVPSELYYGRIAEHPRARRVKLADIADNTLEWRTAQLAPEERDRLAAKYANARRLLGAE